MRVFLAVILAVCSLYGAIYIQGEHADSHAYTLGSTQGARAWPTQGGQAICSCARLRQAVAALLARAPSRAPLVLSLRQAEVLALLPSLDATTQLDEGQAYRSVPRVWGGRGYGWTHRARDACGSHQACAFWRRVLGSCESSRLVWLVPLEEDGARGRWLRPPNTLGT